MTKSISITISSTDTKFLVKLIDWLDKQTVKPNSTSITHSDTDPYKELEKLKSKKQ